eukprot:TRINITY_DN7248_c0_g1_i1.p1 TRINITY_DN7248_c0_g1~~TRINITY_DN7248_c0_g1_i1.p1  ORF type:complete len:401 (-),score=110.11 TRINITY_DN7248_c0_g1_i1:30-1232(-)
MSEALLLVVNAHELSPRAEQYENCVKFLRLQLFSTMLAMSARDVIVALNMHGESEHGGAEVFTEAKQQLTRVISDTCDMYPTWLVSDKRWHVDYVPVNIKRGFNLTPVNQRFSWYPGTDLLTNLAENQQRNYYDEDIWNRLVKSPVYFPLISAMRVRGIGTVAGGILLSGTVQYRDDVLIYPATKFPGDVLSVETNRVQPSNGMLLPGDVAGINLRFTTLSELEPKYGYLVSRYDENRRHLLVARQVFAFRVAVHELNARRLVQHQCYHVFYGTARFVCIVAWRFPAETVDRPSEHVILVPLTHYPVEPYTARDTQKNCHGKVLLVIGGTCAAVGRIDHVLHGPNPYAAPTLPDYKAQYSLLVTQPDPLFSLNEREQREQFIEHVKHSRIRAMLTNTRNQ